MADSLLAELALTAAETPYGIARLAGVYRSPESFTIVNRQLRRAVRLSSGEQTESILGDVEALSRLPNDQSGLADLTWLRTPAWPTNDRDRGTLRVVDLFSGCGAMSLGLAEAARALQMHFVPLLACDVDATALEVYSENFRTEPFPALDLNGLSSLVNGASTPFELSLSERIRSDIDFLVAGPPCQGHSNLNNYTRRNDPKNGLYIKVARFARLFEPKCILIENVPTVTRDKSNVVPRTMNELAELGYSVQIGVLDLSRIGVPQTRKRHVLIAAKGVHSSRVPTVRRLMSAFAASPRTVRWALRDLLSVRTKDLYDVAPAMSQETRRRIDHLFDNNLFELPDEERPDCHRTKDHSYGSVYGRMRWDSPAPTITRGFSTMGQGRFVHPRRRRTITPHEAARLQLIPDFFSFGAARTRKALGALIGNAVPPKLSYVVALELLR